jgi:pseudouridine kinase
MNKKFDVAVIGTIFVDVKGFPNSPYDPRGRNLGNVSFFHGGVGRNVVETMAQLDVSTTFVSTVDPSALGQEVVNRLREHQVDTHYIEAMDKGMGMWLAILDERGDLAGSISQMPSLEVMETSILRKEESFMKQVNAVALEIDLNERIADSIVKKAVAENIPLFGIPGNLDVLGKRVGLLAHFQCFICNDVEAEKLTNIALSKKEDIQKAAKILTAKGLQQIVITLGSKGCYFYDSNTKEEGFINPESVEVIDTTGAGDSFFAGTVSALIKGQALSLAVQLGSKVAGLTISSAESTCLDLRERIKLQKV